MALKVEAKSAAWQVASILVPLVALFAFFWDVFAPHWPAWVLSPFMVFGFYAAISVAEDTIARPILWQVALIIVAFAGIYDIVDAVADIAILPDWPVFVVATLGVGALWYAMSALVSVEDD